MKEFPDTLTEMNLDQFQVWAIKFPFPAIFGHDLKKVRIS